MTSVNLEGINYTIPEIQTILDGVTVGGHKIADQQVVTNQNNAWQELFTLVKNNEFNLSKAIACKIHNLAGYNDALLWGCFRDVDVSIAGKSYNPPSANNLDSLFNNMTNECSKITNIYNKATYVFLNMARNQYFYNINTRTGRFMMNGILLSAGYPVINVKAKDKLQFNTLMLEFYESGNMEAMHKFLINSIDAKAVNFMNQDITVQKL
jgi:Fic family protein